MPEGWIKLHRKIEDWRWSDSPETFSVFVHLLLMASHKDCEWHGEKIPTGSLITSRQILAKKTGVSEMSIRTILGRLKSTNEITSKSTNKYTVISIINYGDYQQINQQTNKQLTSNQPATNHIQEYKELKELNNNTNTKRDSLTPKDFEEISLKYQVPESFVLSKYEDVCNWEDEKPGRMRGRNWKLTLMSWVKKDAIKIKQEAHGKSTIGYVKTE